MSDLVLGSTGVLLAVVGFVCMIFGVPMIIFYTIKMGRCKTSAQRTWKDFWGLNRNNLIFFPSLLDERGRTYRKLAIKGWIIALIGGLSAVMSMLLGTFGPGTAP